MLIAQTWQKVNFPRDGLAFCARVTNRRGGVLYRSCYYTTREEAVAEAFAARPTAKEVSSGYGVGGNFGIEWHKREGV